MVKYVDAAWSVHCTWSNHKWAPYIPGLTGVFPYHDWQSGVIFAPSPSQNSETTVLIYTIPTSLDRACSLSRKTKRGLRRVHRWRHRSGQSQNVWRFGASGFVVHYSGVSNGNKSILQHGSYCVVWGQRQVKLKVLCLGYVIRVFWSVFVKNVKNDSRTLLNSLYRAKFENPENAEIPGNIVKIGLFRLLKYQNTVVFQDVNLKFCKHIHLSGFFRIHSVFL